MKCSFVGDSREAKTSSTSSPKSVENKPSLTETSNRADYSFIDGLVLLAEVKARQLMPSIIQEQCNFKYSCQCYFFGFLLSDAVTIFRPRDTAAWTNLSWTSRISTRAVSCCDQWTLQLSHCGSDRKWQNSRGCRHCQGQIVRHFSKCSLTTNLMKVQQNMLLQYTVSLKGETILKKFPSYLLYFLHSMHTHCVSHGVLLTYNWLKYWSLLPEQFCKAFSRECGKYATRKMCSLFSCTSAICLVFLLNSDW